MMQKLKPCPYCKEIWLYASNGYYYAWRYDDAPTTARKMGGGIGSETVRNVVGLCLQIGLFDKDLFDRESILTSRGIHTGCWTKKSPRVLSFMPKMLFLSPNMAILSPNMAILSTKINKVK